MTEQNKTPAESSAPALSVVAGYALQDTRIEQAGVMRCCLATVAEEYQGKEGPAGDQCVQLGQKSKCRHCGQVFTLTLREGKRPRWVSEAAWSRPVWKPDWQLSQHNTKVSHDGA